MGDALAFSRRGEDGVVHEPPEGPPEPELEAFAGVGPNQTAPPSPWTPCSPANVAPDRVVDRRRRDGAAPRHHV
jgi:hypothetical protein